MARNTRSRDHRLYNRNDRDLNFIIQDEVGEMDGRGSTLSLTTSCTVFVCFAHVFHVKVDMTQILLLSVLT
jgi:hypothetical protein